MPDCQAWWYQGYVMKREAVCWMSFSEGGSEFGRSNAKNHDGKPPDIGTSRSLY